jgi:hypothetical protein
VRPYRTEAQWHALLAQLRDPGDTLFAVACLGWARTALRRCAPEVARYVRLQKVEGGILFVRLAEPKNFTRQMTELAVGEELTLPAKRAKSLASLATRVRRAFPRRRYRTHRDRREGTFSVLREA